MSQLLLQLEKLEEVEMTAKPIIQEIQQEIDESANKLATQNAEYLKQKQELEEKYQKENAELESKNWERNANFVKEMTILKERLKEKVNWSQVDQVMDKKLVISPIANPKGNFWNKTTNISTDGLKATNNIKINRWQSVYAAKGFAITLDSSGSVLFYFEVTNMSSDKHYIFVGLSSGNIPNDQYVGGTPNSYGFHFNTAVISTGSPESQLILNGQMAPLNLNGMTKEM